MALQHLHADTFEPHVNTSFRICDGAGRTIDVLLARVDRLSSSPTLEQFSVVFRGPANLPLAQGTYQVEHDTLGAFQLFITPIVGSGPTQMFYEACFNRRRPGGAA
jgi:hypothetical protein